MKKIGICFIIVISSLLYNISQSSAGEIVWQTSKAEALALAKSQGKKILLFAGSMT
ncbi:Uncharacterized protein dnl_61000 [Desulfonema limicola]|uniref:Uncharacterized protein n=1 Tax=Desulfonema limicola TaxID=45656 RepID=A0A975BDY8_9BACT|nr:hypothetical protein [Desulfonema limicola]QTA83686.1 Uncharacterized protein dnl_61000 [Desulfonema limicola]